MIDKSEEKDRGFWVKFCFFSSKSLILLRYYKHCFAFIYGINYILYANFFSGKVV